MVVTSEPLSFKNICRFLDLIFPTPPPPPASRKQKMTDFGFDVNNTSSIIGRPVTKAGLVPANARLAGEMLDERLEHGAYNTLWPSAPMERHLFRALPDEIALTPIRGSPSSHGDGLHPVFSVLNGINSAGESWREVVESYAFGGVIGSQGAKFGNGADGPSSPDVMVQFGGLATIWNTGKTTIYNGEPIYWDIPEPGEIPAYSTRDGRIRVAIRPYRPSEQKVTAKAIRDYLVTAGNRAAARSDPSKNETQIADAANAITRFARTMAVMSLEMYLASGLVRYDRAAAGSDQASVERRKENAARWMSLPPAEREDMMVRVSRAMRIPGVRDLGDLGHVRMPYAQNLTMPTYLTALLTCKAKLVREVEGSFNVPSGDKGVVYSAQYSALEDLLAAVSKANGFITNRIFARAIGVLKPGHSGDVNIGSYVAGN